MRRRLRDAGEGLLMLLASPFMFAWMLWDASRRERETKRKEAEREAEERSS